MELLCKEHEENNTFMKTKEHIRLVTSHRALFKLLKKGKSLTQLKSSAEWYVDKLVLL